MASHALRNRSASDQGRPPRAHPVRRLAAVVLGALVLLAVALAAATAVVPRLAGATTMTVLTGSMAPTFPVGTVLVVRPQPVERIAAGDVITFLDRAEGSSDVAVVTHRVLEVRPGPEFVTKGDANEEPDQGVVRAADVRGVLWYDVPWAGSVRDALSTPVGLLFAGGAALALVAGHLLLPATARSRRRAP